MSKHARIQLFHLAPWLALLLSLASPLAAAPPVPEPLKPWVPWVLAKHPDLACPLLDGKRLCAWPGRLTLNLDDRGGSFTLEVEADRELDLALPGDAVHWPEEVKVDGRTALMRRLGERPAVRLAAGSSSLAGRFRWSRLPESLAVPPEVALVDLRLRGQSVRQPHREAGGLLWLAASRDREAEQELLTLAVHRRIDDGVPVKLTTHLRLRVSGRAREVDLGAPLPAGFELAWLGGQLPLRWAEGERLVVQARPGSWEIVLEARSTSPVGELALSERPEPWPEREVWVFAADPSVRAVRLGGAPGIDPQRTALPEEWQSLPAFQLVQGDALGFTELRRGEAEPAPDAVRFSRTWWLAQDGDRFTVRDSLEGEIHRGGRLEVLAPAELGRASLGDRSGGTEAGGQVVTLGPESQRAGIEVRAGTLALGADLTYPRGGALPAAGWSRDAQTLGIELYLPPGWTLLAATGADRAAGSWVDRWTLLDFFLLLILALATWKLDGWRWGLLALVLLGLAWHEPWATGLWCWWLLLLPLRALLRVLDEGAGARLVRGLRWLAVVGFAVQVVVFCFVQWRTGRSPQLEMIAGRPLGDGVVVTAQPRFQAEQKMAEPASPPPMESEIPKPVSREKRKSDRYAAQQARSAQIDPNAVVQTGPGVPSWSWNRCSLSWSGPVSAGHELRLFLVPPIVELLLSLLRIAGAVLIALFLIDPRRTKGAAGPEGSGGAVLTSALGLACLLALPAAPVAAQAAPETPAPSAGVPLAADLLQELENRLTAVPVCHPACVEVPRLSLKAAAEGLTIDAEVHAAAPSAWRLPGPAAAWAPGRIRVDGRATAAVRLGDDGFLLLRLAPGVHRVEASGPAADSLALQFPLRPRRLSVAGDGWTIDGYRPDEPTPGSLRLDRQLPLETTPGEAGAVEPEPWLELRRELDIGLPWLVHHELRRVGPGAAAVLVRVPLLAGESVTTAGIPVEAGEAEVRLESGETSRRWQSTLEETATLTLKAPGDRPWLERWELACSPMWNCRAEGLVPSRHMQDGTWRPQWRPWPGEEVILHFVRPDAAPGQTLTVDSAELRVEPGRRLLEATLNLSLRASRGGEQTLFLPGDAALQSFQVDGQSQPAQIEEGRLVFTLEPGRHQIEAAWRQEHDAAFFERIPELRLDGEAVNVGVTVEVPDNRWLLWAGGPGWGPVVKFWEYLAALALVAWALGRFTQTPLSAVDWLLLGAGMTQVPLAAAVIVVLWLLVLSGRHHWRPKRWWSYDFGQLLIFAWGLVAFGILYAAIHTGLLVQPDMQVLGPGSWGSTLRWYVERTAGALPRPWLLWLPLWVWRLLMLLWSLWLAARLLRWLPWCWQRVTLGPALVSPKGFRRWRESLT